jgi:VWFA-related protein
VKIGFPLLGLLAVVAASPSQLVPRVVHLRQPVETDIITGRTRVVVDVLPETAIVRDVVVQVDGREVCRWTSRPFRCEFEAGGQVTPRTIRVAATWGDGERQVRTIRTTGLEVQDATTVESVVVAAHVTDRRGRFVPGLTAKDFRVLEDGVEQPVGYVGAEQVPNQVLLALDISGSMGQSMTTLRQAARGFLAALKPVDQASISAFNTGLFVLAPWGATVATRDAAIDRLRPWGGTAVYDSLIRGADILKLREGRRVLVMFTDGDDIASRGSADGARSALQAHDVILYLLAQGKAAQERTVREQLTALAEGTGGRALFASDVGDLADQFADVVDDLSKLYVLVYTPKNPLGDGRWRSIVVEPVNRDWRVRARQGFFASRRSAGDGQP